MPVTDELGNEVLTRLRSKGLHRWPAPFGNGRFEAWLSRLAEDQPDLDSSENLENRWLFQLVTKELALVLNARTSWALGELVDCGWLADLIGTWHARGTTVITFNQDTLLELSLNSLDLYGWDTTRWEPGHAQPRIGWWDPMGGLPPWPSVGLPPAQFQPTFRLLKLHGSTNWYWVSGDSSGSTIALWWHLDASMSEEDRRLDEVQRQLSLPGREPLIVPPSAAKSRFYQTTVLAQIWRNARQSLLTAEKPVALIGYSLPSTDLVTAGMLRESLLESSRERPIGLQIVNPSPGPVLEHLSDVGFDAAMCSQMGDVGEFVAEYVAQAASDVVAALRDAEPEPYERLLLCGSGIPGGFKVTALQEAGAGDLRLVLEEDHPPFVGTNVAPEGTPPPASLADLMLRLQDSLIRRLFVDAPGGRSYVVGAHTHTTNVGAGNGRWQILVTSRSLRRGY